MPFHSCASAGSLDPSPRPAPDRKRLASAIVAGAFLAACFPPFGYGLLAWAAIAPLLWALDGARPRQAAGRAYLCGLVAMGGIGWFTTSFGDGSAWMRLLPWALFAGIEAAFFIPVGLLLSAVLRRGGPWGTLFAAPAVWVLGEWLRGAGAFGFPFGFLAYALAPHAPAIQTARLGGCWMVSYLAALASAALFLAVARRAKAPALAGAALIVIALGWGCRSAHTERRRMEAEAGRGVPVLVAQGDVNAPWGAPGRDEAFAALVAATRGEARRAPVRLIVWSESALPGPLSDPTILRAVAGVAQAANAPVLTGSILFDPDGNPMNVAVLVAPSGREAGRYAKRRLVPWGEWVPLRHVLPLLDRFGVIERDEVPGKAWTVLRQGDLVLGTPICFESAAPEISRAFVRRGANVLAVITNDGWFGHTGMAEQHAAIARLRAVETGRWVVRCGHTGISGFAGPDGRWRNALPLNRAGVTRCAVAPRFVQTPFVRFGDWFLGACAVLAVLPLARRAR